MLGGGGSLGEAEDIAAGITGEFSLTLEPGEYTPYCPGGRHGRAAS